MSSRLRSRSLGLDVFKPVAQASSAVGYTVGLMDANENSNSSEGRKRI